MSHRAIWHTGGVVQGRWVGCRSGCSEAGAWYQWTPAAATGTAPAGSSAAVALRAKGESAYTSVTDLALQLVVALEVGRDRGDWQRNLVVLFELTTRGASVDLKILDDEQKGPAGRHTTS